jgi:two-component system response regulator AtoC
LAVLVVCEGRPGFAEELLPFVREFRDIPVVTLTPEDQIGLANEANKAGAKDFVRLPLAAEELAYVHDKVVRASLVDDEPPPTSARRSGLVGSSRGMKNVQQLIGRAALGTATVLIRGESGTGKELVARAIHQQSPRGAGPFIKVQCSALPDALLESELFGYEKGAFTGATARKPGRVELCEGGTLFLDEIGDISPQTQVKLLRLLQDRQYERLGGTETRSADVRFVAATHRDLEAMVRKDQFRADLFYRLNVVPLWLPPLRARRSDIELLAHHFCKLFAETMAKDVRLSDGALRLLRSRRWPGNVRQLQNFMERLVVLAPGDELDEPFVRSELSEQATFNTQGTHESMAASSEPHSYADPLSSNPAEAPPSSRPILPLSEEVRAAEKKALLRALKHTGGNRTLTARILGVSRATLYNKLEEYGLA